MIALSSLTRVDRNSLVISAGFLWIVIPLGVRRDLQAGEA